MGHPHPSSFTDEQFNTVIMKPSQCKQFCLLLPEQHTFRHKTVTHTQRPNAIPPKTQTHEMTILSSEKKINYIELSEALTEKFAHTAEIMKSNEILKELPEM